MKEECSTLKLHSLKTIPWLHPLWSYSHLFLTQMCLMVRLSVLISLTPRLDKFTKDGHLHTQLRLSSFNSSHSYLKIFQLISSRLHKSISKKLSSRQIALDVLMLNATIKDRLSHILPSIPKKRIWNHSWWLKVQMISYLKSWFASTLSSESEMYLLELALQSQDFLEREKLDWLHQLLICYLLELSSSKR